MKDGDAGAHMQVKLPVEVTLEWSRARRPGAKFLLEDGYYFGDRQQHGQNRQHLRSLEGDDKGRTYSSFSEAIRSPAHRPAGEPHTFKINPYCKKFMWQGHWIEDVRHRFVRESGAPIFTFRALKQCNALLFRKSRSLLQLERLLMQLKQK